MPAYRVLLAISLLAMLGLVSRCGGSSDVSRSSATPAGPPLHTHSQYAAYASTVNLGPEDVPGYAVAPRRRVTREQEQDFASLSRCAGVAPLFAPRFAQGSPIFVLGLGQHSEALGSGVEVFASSEEAQRELQRAMKALGDPSHCIRRELKRVLSETVRHGEVTVGLDFRHMNFSPLELNEAAGGTDQANGATFGSDVNATVSASGHSRTVAFKLYCDALGFTLGRAMVALVVARAGEQSPSELEARLFATLIQRADVAARYFDKHPQRSA